MIGADVSASRMDSNTNSMATLGETALAETATAVKHPRRIQCLRDQGVQIPPRRGRQLLRKLPGRQLVGTLHGNLHRGRGRSGSAMCTISKVERWMIGADVSASRMD